MNPESSPFTPGQPVSTEFFTGREQQVEELLTMVRMARKRGLQVGWISGERGMGKSSLSSFIRYLAERDEKALVAHVHLGGVDSLEELVQETHLQLLKDNENKSWGKALWGAFEKHVERVGMFGVEIKLKATQDELSAAVGGFSNSLGRILEKTGSGREVLVLIFDDINGLAENPKFSHWLKSMVDGEATSGRNNRVCLIFVGLDERLDKMKTVNRSVGRIFQPQIKINPWTPKESGAFFKNSFDKRGIAIAPERIKQLALYSGGLPAIAHEIGNSVWRVISEDKPVGYQKVMLGILLAAEIIGERFLERDVIQALQSEKYRSILLKLSRDFSILRVDEIEFSKDQLRSVRGLTTDESKNLNNFLSRMRKLGAIVLTQDGRRGVYRFATHMHRMYFLLRSIAHDGKLPRKT